MTSDDEYEKMIYTAESIECDASTTPVSPRPDESPLTASIDCINVGTNKLKARYMSQQAAADNAAIVAPGLVAYLCNRPAMHGRRPGCGYWHFGHAKSYD